VKRKDNDVVLYISARYGNHAIEKYKDNHHRQSESLILEIKEYMHMTSIITAAKLQSK